MNIKNSPLRQVDELCSGIICAIDVTRKSYFDFFCVTMLLFLTMKCRVNYSTLARFGSHVSAVSDRISRSPPSGCLLCHIFNELLILGIRCLLQTYIPEDILYRQSFSFEIFFVNIQDSLHCK